MRKIISISDSGLSTRGDTLFVRRILESKIYFYNLSISKCHNNPKKKIVIFNINYVAAAKILGMSNVQAISIFEKSYNFPDLLNKAQRAVKKYEERADKEELVKAFVKVRKALKELNYPMSGWNKAEEGIKNASTYAEACKIIEDYIPIIKRELKIWRN